MPAEGSNCHFGVNFAGPAAIAGRPRRPLALFADTGARERFKVPTLRTLVRTAPNRHDGRCERSPVEWQEAIEFLRALSDP